MLQLVLRGRRGDAGGDDAAVVSDLVAMIQDAARRFGAAVTDAGARFGTLRSAASGGS